MSDLIRFLSIALAFFAIAGLLIVFGVFDRCSRSASESAIAEQIEDLTPTFNLTASELVQAYRADEESAAAAFDGNVGIVEGPSFLVDESNHLRFFIDEVWAVRCFLSDAEVDRVRTLESSRERVRVGGAYGTSESRGIGSGWPIAFSTLPVFDLKGRVEGVNDRHLTIDLRGCTIHE